MSKSAKWFFGIIGLLLLLGVGVTLLLLPFAGLTREGSETVVIGSGGKVAVVELRGVILSSDDFVRQVKKYRDDRSIKALLIRIDSPGGAVVPSQEMYEELKKTRDGGKPVVVSMGSLAASGGYYVACGGTRLVANRGTLTGSIGVISEFLRYHEAMEKLGLGVTTIKSGALKDAGSPNRPMTEQDRLYFQGLMTDVHRQFMGVVEEERGLSRGIVADLADGRVYTGEQAAELGLVDTIGTYEAALAIAGELGGIEGTPAVVREKKRVTLWGNLLGDVGESVKELKQEMLDRPVMSFRFTGPY